MAQKQRSENYSIIKKHVELKINPFTVHEIAVESKVNDVTSKLILDGMVDFGILKYSERSRLYMRIN